MNRLVRVASVIACGSLGVGCAHEPGPWPDHAAAAETTAALTNTAERLGAEATLGGGPNETAAASAAVPSGYTQTRYPIVLAHGMSGWKALFGVYEYFYRIPAELRAGGAQVYVTSVAAFGSTEARGEQLLEQVEYIAAASGAGKVNLIGHSQGGLDARYVAAMRPDLIASVTTVGTPHEGADLADWLLAHTNEGGFNQAVLQALADSLGFLLDVLAGTHNPQDAIGALSQVSSEGAAVFNARYPIGIASRYCGNGPGVVTDPAGNRMRLYSWSGTSVVTSLVDPTDSPLGVAALFGHENNDGLVGHCSAHFGQVLRDNYGMNHLDEVNQILGLVSLFETNPISVYRAHANRLKNAGL